MNEIPSDVNFHVLAIYVEMLKRFFKQHLANCSNIFCRRCPTTAVDATATAATAGCRACATAGPQPSSGQQSRVDCHEWVPPSQTPAPTVPGQCRRVRCHASLC